MNIFQIVWLLKIKLIIRWRGLTNIFFFENVMLPNEISFTQILITTQKWYITTHSCYSGQENWFLLFLNQFLPHLLAFCLYLLYHSRCCFQAKKELDLANSLLQAFLIDLIMKQQLQLLLGLHLPSLHSSECSHQLFIEEVKLFSVRIWQLKIVKL